MENLWPRAPAFAAAIFAVLVWGIVPVGTRYLVGSATQQIAPLPLLGLRFGIAGLLLLPIFLLDKPWRWGLRDVLLTVAAAGFGVIGYNLPVTMGQVHASASVAALVIATEPLWILLLWSIRTREMPTRDGTVGAGLGVAGILALVIGSGWDGQDTPTLSGIALVVVGAFCWAAYCVIIVGLITRRGAIGVSIATIVLGSIPLLAVAMPALPTALPALNATGFATITFLAVVSTVMATFAWNYAVGRLPGPASGQFLYALPLVGIGAGHVWLGEPISGSIMASALLIGFGLLTAGRRKR